MNIKSIFLILSWVIIASSQTFLLYKEFLISAIIIWLLVIILILKELEGELK